MMMVVMMVQRACFSHSPSPAHNLSSLFALTACPPLPLAESWGCHIKSVKKELDNRLIISQCLLFHCSAFSLSDLHLARTQRRRVTYTSQDFFFFFLPARVIIIAGWHETVLPNVIPLEEGAHFGRIYSLPASRSGRSNCLMMQKEKKTCDMKMIEAKHSLHVNDIPRALA